jgi:hypothetical protein
VIRWDGARLPAPVASVDVAWTWIQRVGAAAAGVLLVFARLRWRQRVVEMAPGAASNLTI